jgi:hypothetical protein
MYLSVVSSAGTNVLSWNAYIGFTPARYVIFRGPTLSSLVRYDSVPSSSLAYTDMTPVTNDVYMIEAVNPSGPCIPTMTIKRRAMSAPLGDSVEYAITSSLSGSMSNGFNTLSLGTQNIGNAVSSLDIYPNPSNGQITIAWSVGGSQSSEVRMSIMDELGQVVYDNTEAQKAGKNTKQLNLENLASGIYTLRMQTNSGSTVKKLVIMKK